MPLGGAWPGYRYATASNLITVVHAAAVTDGVGRHGIRK
jgi:hypothetical protein